jgi:tRNA(Ile)-lysidine synthase
MSKVRLGRWAEEADEVISAQVQSCWTASCRKNAIKNGLLPKAQIVLDIDAILPYYKMIRKYTLLKAICAAAGTEVALKATDLDRAELLLHAQRTGTLLELSSGVRLIKHGREIDVAKASEIAGQYKLTPGRNRQLARLGYRTYWRRIRSGPYENGSGLAADLLIQDSAGSLILRTAQEGDRFHPLGAPGEKRLFRFLTDRKVSRLDKRQTWVLEEDGRIIWVIGHRISEHARVPSPSQQAWRLTFIPMDSEHNGC